MVGNLAVSAFGRLATTTAGPVDPIVWLGTESEIFRCSKSGSAWSCPAKPTPGRLVPLGGLRVARADGCQRVHVLDNATAPSKERSIPPVDAHGRGCQVLAVDGDGNRGVIRPGGDYFSYADGTGPSPVSASDFFPSPATLKITSARYADSGALVLAVDDAGRSTVYRVGIGFNRLYGERRIFGIRTLGNVLDARAADAYGATVMTLEQWGNVLVTRRYHFDTEGFAQELRERVASIP